MPPEPPTTEPISPPPTPAEPPPPTDDDIPTTTAPVNEATSSTSSQTRRFSAREAMNIEKRKPKYRQTEPIDLDMSQDESQGGVSFDTPMEISPTEVPDSPRSVWMEELNAPAPAPTRAASYSLPSSKRHHPSIQTEQERRQALRTWLENPTIPTGDWTCENCAKSTTYNIWAIPMATNVCPRCCIQHYDRQHEEATPWDQIPFAIRVANMRHVQEWVRQHRGQRDAAPTFYCENCAAQTNMRCPYCRMCSCIPCKDSGLTCRCALGREDIEWTSGTEVIQIKQDKTRVFNEAQHHKEITCDVCTESFRGEDCPKCAMKICPQCEDNNYRCMCSTQEEWNHIQNYRAADVIPARTPKTVQWIMEQIRIIHNGHPVPLIFNELVKAAAVRLHIYQAQQARWDRQLILGIASMQTFPVRIYKPENEAGYNLHSLGVIITEITTNSLARYRIKLNPNEHALLQWYNENEKNEVDRVQDGDYIIQIKERTNYEEWQDIIAH